MNWKYLTLPAMIIIVAGCTPGQQVDLSEPLQQLSNSVQTLNQNVTSLAERVDKLEKEPASQPARYKVVSDEKNYISISVPDNWLTENPAPWNPSDSSELSALLAHTRDFVSHVAECGPEGCLCTPTLYDAGAQLEIKVYKRSLWVGTPEFHGAEGGATNVGVTSTKNVTVDGKPGISHVFKAFCGGQDGQLDAHIEYNGTVYELVFNFNPTAYGDAETTFSEILASVDFLK